MMCYYLNVHFQGQRVNQSQTQSEKLNFGHGMQRLELESWHGIFLLILFLF